MMQTINAPFAIAADTGGYGVRTRCRPEAWREALCVTEERIGCV